MFWQSLESIQLFLQVKIDFIKGSSDGTIRKWNRNFDCIQTVYGHTGIILSLNICNGRLVSSASDQKIKLWDISMKLSDENISPQTSDNRMISSLSKLISFPTVSGQKKYLSDCRNGAKFLRSLFKHLGGETNLIPNPNPEKNPLVFAKVIIN